MVNMPRREESIEFPHLALADLLGRWVCSFEPVDQGELISLPSPHPLQTALAEFKTLGCSVPILTISLSWGCNHPDADNQLFYLFFTTYNYTTATKRPSNWERSVHG